MAATRKTSNALDGFEIKINANDPVYVISVVSELVHIPVWTLRKLDDMDIVKPKRIGKKTRCYSSGQVKMLLYIHYLMEEKRVNISGIRVILEMGDIL
ncbi:MAG: MerR family transcriptional regulator [Candidatus Omnitrophota bacterium]|nr:MerR family transcriptional regulator [Candidatus Omnitrophota bacterium]MDZ4242144.1 MerR family transcriptional regulator [Candidatus Omnitrophota bacterium]